VTPKQEIVITGVGVVSPIGIGNEAFWTSLCEGRSGVHRLDLFEASDLPVPFGADVADFDPKQYIRPRKSLKVMSRDIQLAFAAAELACSEASLHEKPVDPERLGVVFGADLIRCEPAELAEAFRRCTVDGEFDFSRWGEVAMAEMFPLWLLKYLPNMPACHVGIAQDARGPNNSLILADVSSLSAVAEATRVLERGQADVIIVGGASTRIHPAFWIRGQMFELSRRSDDPAGASRPFDAQRDGAVNGEGAAAFILETRRHAEARGVTSLARVLGFASSFEPCRNRQPLQGKAIRRAITQTLEDAGLSAGEIGHVNANGASTILDDQIEAQAIRDILADVPVTAPKSFFGNLGPGTGAVEMAVSVLALQHGIVPPTLNYEHPDPHCPVSVIHGQPSKVDQPTALVLNHTNTGQAVTLLLAALQ
jgi:3-oxoacyl-[acyl-carrier-protein] synthase II